MEGGKEGGRGGRKRGKGNSDGGEVYRCVFFISRIKFTLCHRPPSKKLVRHLARTRPHGLRASYHC